MDMTLCVLLFPFLIACCLSLSLSLARSSSLSRPASSSSCLRCNFCQRRAPAFVELLLRYKQPATPETQNRATQRMPGAKRKRQKRQPVKKRRRVAQPAEGPYGHTTGRRPYTRRPGEAHTRLGGWVVYWYVVHSLQHLHLLLQAPMSAVALVASIDSANMHHCTTIVHS